MTCVDTSHEKLESAVAAVIAFDLQVTLQLDAQLFVHAEDECDGVLARF